MLTNYQNKALTNHDLGKLEERRSELILQEGAITEDLRSAQLAAAEAATRLAESADAVIIGRMEQQQLAEVEAVHARAASLVAAIERRLETQRRLISRAGELIRDVKSSRERELSDAIAKADFEENQELGDELRAKRRELRGMQRPPEPISPSAVKIIDARHGVEEVLYDPSAGAAIPMYGSRQLVTPPDRWTKR